MALAILVAVPLLFAIALAGCAGTAAGPGPAAPAPAERRLASLVLERVEGGHYDIADLEGKPAIVMLFTTYSLYSQHIFSLLVPVWERRSAEGLEVVAVSTEPEAKEVLRAYRDFLEIPFPVLRGDESVHQGVSPLGTIEVVPMLLFVDRRGEIVARVATVENQDALDEAVEHLLEN